MKKRFLIICLFCFFMFTGCFNEKKKIEVLLPGATPLVSIGGLLENDKFNFTIVNGQDPLSSAFLNDDYDIIIAPLNLGAKLHLAGNTNFKFEAIITMNNAYLVSFEEFDISDINNKKIVTFGKGSAPWLTLRAVLDKYSYEIDAIEKNSVSDVAESILGKTEDASYYLMDEPTNTKLKLTQDLNIHTIDLSNELGIDMIFACLFINPNSNIKKSDLEIIENNIKALNQDPISYANKIINAHTYFKNLGLEVLKEAIPKCNITYLKAKNNKTKVEGYFEILNKYNPNVLGGKNPNENFYN